MFKFALRSALLVIVVALAVSVALAQQPFALKDGDTVVMLGDSITAQHLHTSYMEAYALSRFPGLQLRFRNAGVGGVGGPTGAGGAGTVGPVAYSPVNSW